MRRSIKHRWVGLLLALFVCCGVSLSYAGYVINVKYTDRTSKARPVPVMTFLDSRKVKLDTSGLAGYQSAILYDRDDGIIRQVRYSDKEFLALNTETLGALQSGVRGTVDFLQEQFGRMSGADAESDAERAPSYKLEKMPDQKMVAGLPCRQVRVYADGVLVQDIWYTSWKKAGIRKSDMIGLIKLGEFYDQMWDIPGAGALTASMMRVPVDSILNLTGYPVLVNVYDAGRPQLTIELGRPRKTTLRPAVFAVPQDFKRIWM